MYRVIQEENSIFWEVIVSVIVRKKVLMNICIIWYVIPTRCTSHRVFYLTLRRLMSYIYIYIYMEHPFLMFLDHTQRRSTVGRTPLDE